MTPPRERDVQPNQMPPLLVHVLQHPQPLAEVVLPLRVQLVENHDVRIISLGKCEDTGKAKVVEVEVLLVKKTRRVEPTIERDEEMEEEAKSSKASKVRNNKKQKAHFHRCIELHDFPLGTFAEHKWLA